MSSEYRFKEIIGGMVEMYWFNQLIKTLSKEDALYMFHKLRDASIKNQLENSSK